ncbi:aminotransferase class I and II [Dactylonectria macrodidyma]|uniref:Aminotransferase class I and II n=1 Tax=Dactylonectria macrodidyma TaxID=307937 RepID=A0A9P9E726_9HYPO|nr:aminotransferase class I and II [Dactylonectria macrodidyma]
MVRLPEFDVERWMNEYETTPGAINTAETCVASVSIDDLSALSLDKTSENPINFSTKLLYGPIRGSTKLRERVAGLYNSGPSGSSSGDVGVDDVLITQGAIGANFLSLYTLINPGDHVICVYPTYQQLYSLPESIGAEVSLWRLTAENGNVPDVTALESLAKPNTKMIIINNPNNPTGAPIPAEVLTKIVEFAKARDIILFSDEVYRPLFHDLYQPGYVPPPSVATMGYERAVVTGSMSKAFAMAGIRVGWVVSKDKKIVDAMAAARDYTSISVSQIDDQIAAYALSPSVISPLLERNVGMAKANVALLEKFVNDHKHVCSWVKPKAGTTAFVRFAVNGEAVDDERLCLDLLEKTKVFLVPGSRCFGGGKDFKGYVRFGYVCEADVLKEGLEKFSVYIEEHFN